VDANSLNFFFFYKGLLVSTSNSLIFFFLYICPLASTNSLIFLKKKNYFYIGLLASTIVEANSFIFLNFLFFIYDY
jgi:hypothetical protein